MGIVEQMKRLHKQALLKLQDIKRIMVADEAGVNSDDYLNRAKSLKDYVSPDTEAENIDISETSVPSVAKSKANTKKTAKTIKL